MSGEFSETARRLGILSALSIVVLEVAYAITLVIGLLSLESPQQPIGEPMFSILEALILVLSPAMVGLMVAMDAWAAPQVRFVSLMAIVFASLLCGVTCCVHFAILTLSRQPAFGAQPWLVLFLSFQWPSLAYALDILAWDVFFPLAMLCVAPVFAGGRLATAIRILTIAAGLLALAGLLGVVAGDMKIRNVGIVGYVGVFPLAAALLALLFYRTRPANSTALPDSV
jgi:hypothetical protein